MPAQQDFLEACQQGNLARVNALIAQYDISESSWLARGTLFALRRDTINVAHNNNEALQLAALNGHLAIVNRLLEIPAVRDNAADNNNLALVYAAQHGHLAIINRLLEIPAVGDNAAANDNQMLRYAALFGHLGMVNCLLAIPAVRDNAAVENNRALRMAARHGHLPLVTRLLAIPDVVEAIHQRGEVFGRDETAIVEAFENGHHDVVAALQARGAILPEHLREHAAARPGRAAAVINDRQSVHVVSVHVSVSSSAKNLVDFYPDINNPKTVQEQIAGLQAWLNTEQPKARLAEDPISTQINPAIACVERLSRLDDFKDSRSGVSMRQALTLVWMGLNNLNANGAGAAQLTEAEIKNRRESFITCLYEIQRGNNFEDDDSATPVDLGGADSPICIPGAFNKLIAVLAQVGHQEVSLIFVTAETLLIKAKSLPRQIFLGLPPERRAYYAENWEAAPALSAAEESPSDKIQTEFFEECKPLMRNLLKAEFDAFQASIASRHATYEKVMESTIESVIDDAAQVMSAVMQEEKSRLAAAIAAEPVPVTFSRTVSTGEKREDESGDEPKSKQLKP